MSLRTAQEWMRVRDALARLPLVAAAFHEGEITSAHVRLVTRVATPGDEAAWLSRARWMDVRRLSGFIEAARRREEERRAEVNRYPSEPSWLHPVGAEAQRAQSEAGLHHREELDGTGATASRDGREDVAGTGASASGDRSGDVGGTCSSPNGNGREDSEGVGGAAGGAQTPTPAGAAPPLGGPVEPAEDDDTVRLEIRAPAWLMRWWRETIVFAGQLVGRALRPGDCLGVLLAESASGTGAALAGADGSEARGATPVVEIEGATGEAGGRGDAQGDARESCSSEPCLDSACGSEGSTQGRRPAGAGAGDSGAGAGETDAEAERLDASLRDLVGSRQRHEEELATYLECVRSGGTYLDEGFRSLERYALERLGLSARQMYYLLALNRTLERLPDLRRAFVAGRLTLRQTLLCGRVAGKETATAWVRRAEATTLRRLEDEVDFWELIRQERPEVWALLQGGPIPEGIVLVPGKPPRLSE